MPVIMTANQKKDNVTNALTNDSTVLPVSMTANWKTDISHVTNVLTNDSPVLPVSKADLVVVALDHAG